jgi:hypothetical protein
MLKTILSSVGACTLLVSLSSPVIAADEPPRTIEDIKRERKEVQQQRRDLKETGKFDAGQAGGGKADRKAVSKASKDPEVEAARRKLEAERKDLDAERKELEANRKALREAKERGDCKNESKTKRMKSPGTARR